MKIENNTVNIFCKAKTVLKLYRKEEYGMPKEKSIMFKPGPEMVKAIKDKRKSITRQIIKPQPPEGCTFFGWRSVDGKAGWGKDIWLEHCSKPPYQSGDILWVRETFRRFDDGDCFYKADFGDVVPVHADDDPKDWKWQPSIHMPRVAARLFLEVVDVRVEQLQDITEEDAIAEGISQQTRINLGYTTEVSWETFIFTQARDTFRLYWDSLYSKKGFGWNTNPWVYVTKFKLA